LPALDDTELSFGGFSNSFNLSFYILF